MQKFILFILLSLASNSFGSTLHDRPQANVGGKGGNGSISDQEVLKADYQYHEEHCSYLNRPYGTRLDYVCGRLENLILRERATDDQLFYYDDCCLKP